MPISKFRIALYTRKMPPDFGSLRALNLQRFLIVLSWAFWLEISLLGTVLVDVGGMWYQGTQVLFQTELHTFYLSVHDSFLLTLLWLVGGSILETTPHWNSCSISCTIQMLLAYIDSLRKSFHAAWYDLLNAFWFDVSLFHRIERTPDWKGSEWKSLHGCTNNVDKRDADEIKNIRPSKHHFEF